MTIKFFTSFYTQYIKHLMRTYYMVSTGHRNFSVSKCPHSAQNWQKEVSKEEHEVYKKEKLSIPGMECLRDYVIR